MWQPLSKAHRLLLGEGPGNIGPCSEFGTLICTPEGLKSLNALYSRYFMPRFPYVSLGPTKSAPKIALPSVQDTDAVEGRLERDSAVRYKALVPEGIGILTGGSMLRDFEATLL
jgi:hypothetical protein